MTHVLSQPPVQGKAAIAELTRLITSAYFPVSASVISEKIWEVFVEKFEEERRDIRINWTAKEYLRSDEVLSKNWNGREIRNGETRSHFEASGSAGIFPSISIPESRCTG